MKIKGHLSPTFPVVIDSASGHLSRWFDGDAGNPDARGYRAPDGRILKVYAETLYDLDEADNRCAFCDRMPCEPGYDVCFACETELDIPELDLPD